MNKEVKDKWVAALKSGKYKQGRGQLNGESGYCCLGVLTEVYIEQMKKNRKKSKVSKASISTTDCEQYLVNGETKATHLLPKVVAKWAGLNQKQVSWAMCMNDSCKLDFNNIAKCIATIY